ncbi:piezo-type mechanosensitive ion channel component 2-like [Ornithorhynchus anatinus]|uniref:piezo-type mechanosensitive ion channel component 2-like n=1 Tax=Ornithorhynchus anatinus TaxID=9258 RepID=UPI0010A8748C|nr:piezo-type mechanosensitive ion channel component 2-like [Ornithorhynchus anatinus]
MCCTSFLFFLSQVSFQIAFHFVPPDDSIWEDVLHHFGIVRFSQVDAGNIARLLLPDLGMFILSLLITHLSSNQATSPDNKLPSNIQVQDEEETAMEEEDGLEDDDISSSSEESISEEDGKMIQFLYTIVNLIGRLKAVLDKLMTTAGKIMVTLLLGFSGIVSPSVTSAVYFFAFLGLCSWWSCRRALSINAFSSLCVMMAIFTAGHFGILYMYQLPYFQVLVPPDDIYARLLGMTALIKTNMTESWKLKFHSGLKWPVFVNPFILLFSYYTIVTLLHQWARSPKDLMEEVTPETPTGPNEMELDCRLWSGNSEKDRLTCFSDGSWQEVPLLQGDSYKLPSCGFDSSIFIPANDSPTLSGDDIVPDTTEADGSELSIVVVLTKLILGQNYAIVLIIMMVWSITYISWLTFILLIWSCIIWMMRDRRHYALLSSPFLAVYANVLVILNFFVGLNVSQEELFPGVSTSVLTDFDLKPYLSPCIHIIVKIFYAFSFWLLLREYVTERQSQKEEVLKEVTVVESGQEKQTNALFDILGSFIKGMLVKYWIYLCCGMFFIVSFNGKVVVYKILYIMLFISWVALYQIHYDFWRRILKYFWITVVSYSMVVLIAVYGYQFKTISEFFLHTLGFPGEKLRDVGLEQFETVELFPKILLPSTFLLVCILQLHYFNEGFLKITDLNNVPVKQQGLSISKKTESDVNLLVERFKATIQKLQDSLISSRIENTPDNLSDTVMDENPKEGKSEQQDQKESTAKESYWVSVIDKLAAMILKFLELVNRIQVLLWRLLELHIIKIVSTGIIWITLQEVSFMNYLFYIIWVLAVPYPKLRPYASNICTVWSCVMVICKMIYQLKFVKPLHYSSNCTEELFQNSTLPHDNLDELLQTSVLYVAPVDPADWFGGLRKCGDKILPCLQNHIVILALMAIEMTVYRHQTYYRIQNQQMQPKMGSIFDSVTREQLDEGLLSTIKYFINFSFYKFGLEMCLVIALNVIGQRMDFYSLAHVAWLIYLLNRRRRKAIAEAWPRYCAFLSSIMIFQYLLCIGIPPAFCIDYPWRTSSAAIHSNLIKWLYLPDFAKKPDANLLIYDFLLLLYTSLQWQVFEDENKASVRMQAGDNVEISRDLIPEDLSQFSPVPNFIYCRSYLDMAKVIVFSYLFWFVLGVVFLSGTARVNIFCFGYIVAFFYFMLHGSSLLLKPVKFILHKWDYLIAYNVLVIALKNLLSVGACAYLEKLLSSHCWLVHSFSMFCTVKGYSLAIPDDENCELPEKEAGIFWDVICFSFLLIQRRIFTSYYHLYVVAEQRATRILASRGAEMFELKLQKSIVIQEEKERKSKLATTKQMDKIKTKQKKIESAKQDSMSPGDLEVKTPSPQKTEAEGQPHDDSGLQETGDQKKWWQPWVHHPSMVQEGSYSLFETDSEEEEDEEEEKEEKEEEFPKPKTAFQLAYDAWTNNSKTALKLRKQDEIQLRREERLEEQERRRCRGDFTPVTFEDEDETSGNEEEENLGESENIIHRIINILKFFWVFGKVLLDDITETLNSLGKDNLDVSTVLKMERCMLRRAHSRGKEATKASILRYYSNKLGGKVKMPSVLGPEKAAPVEDKFPENQQLPREDGQVPGEEELDLTSQQILGEDGIQPEEEGKALSAACPKQGDSPSLKETMVPRGEMEMGKIEGAGHQIPDTSPGGTESQSDQASATLQTKDPIHKSKISSKTPAKSTLVMLTAEELIRKRMFYDEELDQSEKFYRGLPRLIKLGFALYNLLESKSEMFCYFMIILNHVVSASIISLVVPISCFLWAMLSVPRPPKRFWMAAIFYTEAAVVIKYFSQFGFFPWTTKQYFGINGKKPFSLPNIVGIEKKDGCVQYELVQLLALFFHRSILKGKGLWDQQPRSQDNSKEKRKTKKSKRKENKRGKKDQGPGVESCLTKQMAPKWAFWRKKSTEGKLASTGELEEGGFRKRWKKFREHSISSEQFSIRNLKRLMRRTKKLVIKIALQIYLPIRQFFYDIINPEYSPVCDTYALMFLVEVINFVLVIFGYWAFGRYSEKTDLSEALAEEHLPEAFLPMILIQFGTMIVDRGLYLRKNMFGKCVFQVVLVFAIHFWIFFILPGVTERRFNHNYVVQIWYFIKCIYFGLSAYQIKCGYPSRIMGNYLTKNFNLTNLFLFQGFRFVPFLLELRAVLDWIWTDTALSLSSWISLEELYANVFIMKCWRESEKKYPQPPGQKKKNIVKYGMGGIISFALIFFMWFPLVFMSLLKAVGGLTNQPLGISVKISISGYESLFTMSSQQQNLAPLSSSAYDELTYRYALHPEALQFIMNYEPEDIIVAKIKGNASLLWSISPANREAMIAELSNASSIYVTFFWTIQRDVALVENVEASGKYTVCYQDKKLRDEIVQMLTHVRKEPLILPGLIPKGLRTTAGTEAKIAKRLETAHSKRPQDIDRLAFYRNITIWLQRLQGNTSSDPSKETEWWVIQEWRPSCAKNKGCAKNLELMIYNDKVTPPSMGFLAGYGITGLYVSVVMVVAKFIREYFNGIPRSIMYEELPNVDRVLNLCTDIFLVREMGELELEEQLFSKLIFLYRSPETMIKWTREPEESPKQPDVPTED